jgi:hypothetical protein
MAPNGTLAAAETLTSMKTDRSSGYPRLVADGNGLVFAWTDIGADRSTRVKVARK